MSLFSGVKHKIKTYLKNSYDVQYFQELEEQVTSYDDWVWEQTNSNQEIPQGLMLDLGKEELEKQKNRQRVRKISYEDIGFLVHAKSFEKEEKENAGKEQIIILAEEINRVTPDAVDHILEVFDTHPEVEIVYTDEDEVNHEETVRMNPWLKPDYSPDTLLSYFYFGKMVAFKKEIWEQTIHEIDYKSELYTAKTARHVLYTLLLEACATLTGKQIFHLKKVLYSSHNASSWGYEEEYKKIREHYNALRKREPVSGVSIIIPSKDNPKVLERCIQSIQKWTKDIDYEIIVVDNGSSVENKELLQTMQTEYGFTYRYEPQEFNFSVMCNQGARMAKQDLLLFLNDDCEVRGSKWLSHMADTACVKTTGAVGAKLYYPNSKKIQHCGIYNIHMGPVHKLQFKEDVRPYYDRRNLDVRNVLAVTAACLMVRKRVFEEVKGFDESLQVAFNDVDFCYKLYEAGYNNVVDNTIHLWHHESLSRGSDESRQKLNRLMQEKAKLYEKHRTLWEKDPYYHPGFSTDILDTGYSFDYEYPHHHHLAVEHPVFINSLPQGVREDACVAPMIEYAGDLKGWFLEDVFVEKIQETMKTKKAAYIQGNAVVLGSDNACFETKVILRGIESNHFYEILPEGIYRPDIFTNLADQENVALSGFAFLVNMEEMPQGRYEVGILMTDKISKQSLLRVTTRSIERD